VHLPLTCDAADKTRPHHETTQTRDSQPIARYTSRAISASSWDYISNRVSTTSWTSADANSEQDHQGSSASSEGAQMDRIASVNKVVQQLISRIIVWLQKSYIRVGKLLDSKDRHGVTVMSHYVCTEFSNTRIESSQNWTLDHMVQARWCNCPYSKSIHGGLSENFSGALYYTAPWAFLHVCMISLSVMTSFGGTSKWPLGHIIDDLKTTTQQMSAISGNMARKALGNLKARLEECLHNDEQHFRDVQFKTN
jgi:hypothetical protein